MDGFFPEGVNRRQLELLENCVNCALERGLDELMREAERHLEAARQARQTSAFVNVPLAAALHQSLKSMAAQFDSLPRIAQPWLLGMIAYFSTKHDEETDFDSPVGFEDDAEVINACLRMAGLDHLCVTPEDYDEF